MSVTLQIRRDVVSPRSGNSWGTPPPTRPGDAQFEELLAEVVSTVKMTEQGAWPTEFIAKNSPTPLGGQVPELLRTKLRLGTDARPRPKNMALAVSMDKPWHLGEFLLDGLRAQGVKYKVDRPGTVQFCDADSSYMQIMQELNSSTASALDKVFDVKYHWQEPRPEDYLNIPGEIFTVNGYPAPQHWRYAAGHGGAAGATCAVITRNLQLTLDQEQEVKHACWTFAQARTMLGVHLHEDNELGFNIGLQF